MRTNFFRYFPFLFCLFISIGLSGQNKTSLEQVADITKLNDHDTAKVINYIKGGSYYIKRQKFDSAMQFVSRGLFLAKKIDYKYGIGQLYAMQGDIKVVQNELFQALDYYLTSVKFIQQSNHQKSLVNIYLVIGNIYVTQANYPKALEYYQKGQVFADSLNLVSVMVHFFNNKGELYGNIGQFDKSINNYFHALEIYSDINDSIGQASIHSNLSRIYLRSNKINLARAHLDSAFVIYQKYSNDVGLMNAYNTKAEIEINEDNFEQAIYYYKKGLIHLNKIGTEYKGPKSSLESNQYSNIGYCNMKIQNYKGAKQYLLRAYDIAMKNGQLDVLENVSLYLSQLYELMGDVSNAFRYYREYNTYSDSLSQEDNIKKITQLQMQYEFDKELKQREIEQEKQEAQQRRKELIYLMIIFGVLLAVIILFLLFRLQKNKNKRISLERKNLINDLDYKNKELTTNVMYLLKKNEFILSISDKLKKSRYDFKAGNRKIIDDIIRELEYSSRKDIWKDFEVRFQEVHAGFYKSLNEKFPDLSPNEMKLCAFLRLNMSTKEISTITFQSPKSINMARYRLRKKMEINNYDNLISILSQL